jgi:hypothetical protein
MEQRAGPFPADPSPPPCFSPASSQDLIQPFTSQSIDGRALQALYRTGASSLDALHCLVRTEFGQVRLGHRLRLLEGLCELFKGAAAGAPATATAVAATSASPAAVA